MAYFAQIDENKIVQQVIVADSSEWCEKCLGGTWVETYMNNPDKNYAGTGYEYSYITDNFIGPAPYDSWELNEKDKWEAPIEPAKDDVRWNEDIVQWEKLEDINLISK